MTAIVERFAERGVSFWNDGDELLFDAPPELVGPELLAELRGRRGEILSALAINEARPPAALPTADVTGCAPHNDATNYADTPAPGGMVRTTCRLCGRFIGYRRKPRRRKGDTP